MPIERHQSLSCDYHLCVIFVSWQFTYGMNARFCRCVRSDVYVASQFAVQHLLKDLTHYPTKYDSLNTHQTVASIISQPTPSISANFNRKTNVCRNSLHPTVLNEEYVEGSDFKININKEMHVHGVCIWCYCMIRVSLGFQFIILKQKCDLFFAGR